MANLSIRKLDDKIWQKLRTNAMRHGHSMEEEVRQILSKAVAEPRSITALFQKNFGKTLGIDLDLPPRKPHQPLDFEE